MDIIVKGADFSANRIGVAITQRTLDIVDAYNATLTNTELEGLNTYLNVLDGASIFTKMPRYYLPVLKNDISKSFVNISDNNLAVDILPTVGKVAYTNKGIYNTFNSTTKQLLVPCGSDGFTTSNFSFIAYMSHFDNTVTGGLPNLIKEAASDWYTKLAITSGSDNLTNTDGNFKFNGIAPGFTEIFNGTAGVLSFGGKNQMFGFTLNQGDTDGGHFMKSNGLATRFYTASATGYGVGTLTQGLHLSSNGNEFMKLPQGMIAIGGALTQAELQLINDATKTFMAVMGVNNVA
jgi:hypothetical protein